MWGKRFKEESGSVMLITAISMVVLLSVSALAIDLGRVALEKSKLQNAVDASVLAASQDLPDTYQADKSAKRYIQLNGYEPSDISVTFSDSNRKVKITATKSIEYYFAKIIGVNDVTITASAAGRRERIQGPFEYALFSGDQNSTLAISSSYVNIVGSTHSNNNFTMYVSNGTITGACEAVNLLSISGSSIDVKNRLPNADEIPMPDFSDIIEEKAMASGRVFYGNKSFNEAEVILDEALYVYGDVYVNASTFRGAGTICATGDITFSGSNISSSAEDAVCCYSKCGNINVNGSSVNFDGILYAPNGSVNISASSVNINGRVIGKRLGIYVGSLNVVTGEKELKSLPYTTTKLVE